MAKNKDRIEKELYRLTDGERRAVVEWVRQGLGKEAYEEDRFELKGGLADMRITPKFVEEEGGKRFAKGKSIFQARCARCHDTGVSARYANQIPLTNYDEIADYYRRKD